MYNLIKFLEIVGIPIEGNNNPNQNFTDIEIIKNVCGAIMMCLFIIIGLLILILIFQIIKTFKK